MARIRPFFPALLWMAIIFLLSTSGFNTDASYRMLRAALNFLGLACDEHPLRIINHILRKLLHVSMYAALAYLWYRGFVQGGATRRRALLATFAICALWAISDEIHQSFVAQRTALVGDAALYVFGAAAALLLLKLSMQPSRRRQ